MNERLYNDPFHIRTVLFEMACAVYTVYVPIDAHCASADLRVRVYFKKKKNYFFFC